MTAPLSVRFDETLLDRLRRRAASAPGDTPSGLIQRLVDEGLRLDEHPGITFKDGPSGRRAALARGPDIREVIVVLQELDERGEAAVAAAAEIFALDEAAIRTAIRYYSAYTADIDREIAAAHETSVHAERAWLTEQRLLA